MTRTARELAEFLGATLEGDPSVPISGLASPERARAEDLIFVASGRHLDRAARSRAACVLVASEASLPGKTLVRTPDPKLAFAKAAEWLLPHAPSAAGVHSTAVVAPSARLAAGVVVGPYAVVEEDVEVGAGSEVDAHCFLGRGARLGEHCHLFPRVTLYAGARLGNRVIVHSGAVLGSDGFGYVFGEGRRWKFPQLGGLEIGDDVEIGANTTIDRGSLEVTRIGRGTKLDNLVQVGHNVCIGQNTLVAAQVGFSGSISVGDGVLLGGQAGLGEGCTIEDRAVIGGQCGVLPGKVVRSGEFVWGTPARSMTRFKEQFVWVSRLPELAARVRALEANR